MNEGKPTIFVGETRKLGKKRRVRILEQLKAVGFLPVSYDDPPTWTFLTSEREMKCSADFALYIITEHEESVVLSTLIAIAHALEDPDQPVLILLLSLPAPERGEIVEVVAGIEKVRPNAHFFYDRDSLMGWLARESANMQKQPA